MFRFSQINSAFKKITRARNIYMSYFNNIQRRSGHLNFICMLQEEIYFFCYKENLILSYIFKLKTNFDHQRLKYTLIMSN